jgi:hypothetical protein
MSKRDLLEVAIKVMGLYCLFSFLGSIVALGAGLSSVDSKFIENKTVFVSFLSLACSLYLAFAIVFVCWGKSIAEILTQDSTVNRPAEQGPLPPHAHFYFWIRILGLYFFVSVVGQLVSDVTHAALTVRSMFWWSRLLGETIQIGLSLAFIFQSQRVAKFVEGDGKPITDTRAD